MTDYNLSKEFSELLSSFQQNAVPRAPRGMPTLEVENASYCLPSSPVTPIIPSILMASLDYISAEANDCLLGTNKPKNLLQVDPSWSEAVDRDGTSESMYGYHLVNKLHRNGYSQLEMIARKLILDPDTRQACFTIMRRDHLMSDCMPCTIGMNFRIRDDQLNGSVHMRSQDLVNGLCHDIAFARLVQRLLVTVLTVANPKQSNPLQIGTLSFSVDSLHVYEKDFGFLEQPTFEYAALEDICPQEKIINFLSTF